MIRILLYKIIQKNYYEIRCMKHVHILFPLLALCLLSGCYTFHHSVEPELENLHRRIPYCPQNSPMWGSEHEIPEYEVQQGLSLEDAICKSILVDNDLTTNLENIGIAQADLIQAGYIRNPSVATTFLFSRLSQQDPNNKPYIDVLTTFLISDFWQIPRKKKVAQKDLEIATTTILQQIITLSSNVKVNYFTYMYEMEQLKVINNIIDSIQSLQKHSQDAYEKGHASDYDRSFVDSTLAQWQLKRFDQEQAIYNSLINLRNNMNLEFIAKPIPLTTSWDILLKPIPDAAQLYAYAEKTNLDVQVAKLKVEQARAQQALNRARIVDNVSVGIEYTQQTNGVSYAGPVFGFDLPVFDQQQAQIEKFKRTEEKQIKSIQNLLSNLGADIFNLSEKIKMSQKKIHHYIKKVLPPGKQAFTYAQKHPDSLNINFSLFVTTHVDLSQQEYGLNAEYLNLAKAISELEKRLSGPIPYHLSAESKKLDTVNTVSADVLAKSIKTKF